jgi:hypothetical protein
LVPEINAIRASRRRVVSNVIDASAASAASDATGVTGVADVIDVTDEDVGNGWGNKHSALTLF